MIRIFKYRYGVLCFIVLLAIITFVDRVCLAVAGPRMQEELNITPERWGWVVAAFALSYGLFEIPTGALGDRIGTRKVLPRIVAWWSVFTCLTGAVSGYPALLAIRFLFGAGEAGAFPNASASIARWFPKTERGRAHGVMWMSSRLGGAITPLLVIPVQSRYGWRASFYFFGALGMVWAAAWYWWFRDRPSEMPGISQQEREEIGETAADRLVHSIPWKIALRSSNLWCIILMYHTFAYGSYFYISWLNTYLIRGRGYAEHEIAFLSSLPFFVGAAANLLGGFSGDFLIRKIGVKWGRRVIGSVGMGVSALCMLSAALTQNRLAAVILLALGAGASDFILPTCWATCLDIGRKYAGVVTAAMNSGGQAGSFVSGLLFGYAVGAWKSYDLPLIPISGIVIVGALLWLKIDATRELIPTPAGDAAAKRS